MTVLLALLLWAGQSPARSMPAQPATLTQPATPAQPALAAHWIRVPFVAQTTDGCGSASLAMVMQYWQQAARLPVTAASDAPRIQQQLFSPHAHGIYASRMVEYLRRSGFVAYAFHGQWSDLAHHIALGRPLIVAMREGGGHGLLQAGPLHYVVVVGVDADHVYLNDPARQQMLRLDRSGFLSAWSATDDWTLLALPQPTSAAAPAAGPAAGR